MSLVAPAPGGHWIDADDEELERRWESFLKGKRDGAGQYYQAESRHTHTDERDQPPSMRHEVPAQENREPLVRRVSFRDDRMIDATESHPEKPATSSPKIDMFKMFELFKLFERQNWKGLTKFILSYPQCATVNLKRSSKGLLLTSEGNMLLHEICRIEPPVEVVDAILTANKKAADVKGDRGYLPLHFACAHNASEEVVRRLIRANPRAVEVRDSNDLMLPLHLAVKWGSPDGVLNILVQAHPDARQVRDIYAKIPQDYAFEIVNDQDHRAVMKCLNQKVSNGEIEDESLRSLSERSTSRSPSFNDEKEAVAKELQIAENIVEELNNEMVERESKFADLYSKQQEKLEGLQHETAKLQLESEHSRNLRETQARKFELLEVEHATLKSLQKATEQKKSLLEKKIEVLLKANEVKQELIQRLEHENHSKYNEEMTRVLLQQEKKYTKMLDEERQKVAELQKKAKEVEITHRLYTRAILEEHDREAADFEGYTREFKNLEDSLRKQLKDANDNAKNLQAEFSKKEAKFKEAVSAEQAKIAFLENHVSKLNNLLESEQTRFQELETILKRTIETEDGEREELIAAFTQQEQQYENQLESERRKASALEQDYNEVRELLKTESEKVNAFEAYERELKKLIEAEQLKSKKLEIAHQEYKKIVDNEQQKVANMELAESRAQSLLRSEQQKVHHLERSQAQTKMLLQAEKQTVAELRRVIEEKEMEFSAELRHFEAVKDSQNHRQQSLEAFERKIADLEAQLKDKVLLTQSQQAKLDMTREDLYSTNSSLEEEKKKVYDLLRAKQDLEKFLAEQKQRVRELEEAQVVCEAEYSMDADDTSEAHSQLHQNQELLNIERTRVECLEEENSQLAQTLESETQKISELESSLKEKEAFLASEKARVSALEEEKLENEGKLKSERQKVTKLETELRDVQLRLESEQHHVSSLQATLEEARVELDRRAKAFAALSETENEKQEVVISEAAHREIEELKERFDQESTKVLDLEATLAAAESKLFAERDSVAKLESEVSDLQDLLDAEKQVTSQLTESISKTNGDLQNEKKRVDHLEQEHARKQVLLDSERNKVLALEHSRDQLQSLLEWEQLNIRNRAEKQAELEMKLKAAEVELSDAMGNLHEKEIDVDSLNQKIALVEDLKKKVIQLSTQGKRRDALLASVLSAIEEDKKMSEKDPVKKARVYIEDLQGIIGLDLAGLDKDAILADNMGGALITTLPGDVSTFRRVRRTLYWTLPLIPIVAIANDPSLLDDISAGLDPQMLREMASQYPGMLRDMVGPETMRAVQEPLIQMFGMASGVATSLRGPRMR